MRKIINDLLTNLSGITSHKYFHGSYKKPRTKRVYQIEITETLQMTVPCEAYNEAEAESIVCSKYRNEEYVLGAEHLTE